MKPIFVILASLSLSSVAEATLPSPDSFLTMPEKLIRLIHKNVNGWTKLNFKDQRIWAPTDFYSQKIKDPKRWIAHVQKLGFCEPDKAWEKFPVLTVSNSGIDESFQLAVQNPNTRVYSRMSYTALSWMNGKSRSVSYDFTRGGPKVEITCSATNEDGESVNISQEFDVSNPKKFKVEQKKNGKLI